MTWFSCGSQREGQLKHDSFQLIRRNEHPLNKERTLCIASQSEPPPRCLPRVSRTPTRAPRVPARRFRCLQAIPRFGEPHGTSRPNLSPPSAGAQEKNHGGTPRSRYGPPRRQHRLYLSTLSVMMSISSSLGLTKKMMFLTSA